MKRIMIVVMLMAAGQAYAADAGKADTPEALWENECGSCHIAYPARFLNAETWQRLMSSLDKHFGDDASLDEGSASLILQYLQRRASTHGRHSSKTMRISDTAWFRHEHDEISPSAWTGPIVKSPANCSVCHVNAVRGDWSERGVRMPSGVSREGDDDDRDDD